jgi:membrane protease YdiL (CAAX protease family)
LTPRGGWGGQLVLGLAAGGLAIVLYVVLALAAGRWEAVAFRPAGEIRGLLLMATLTTAYIGFWEETLCRGYLLRAIGGRHGIVTLALISGAAFVPFHFTQFGAVPQYFILYWFLSGVAYALPLLITGSLWISAGMHWGHNLLFALLLSRDGWMVAERAAAPPPFSEYLILVVAAAMIPLAWGAGRLSLRYGASAHLEPVHGPVHERAH